MGEIPRARTAIAASEGGEKAGAMEPVHEARGESKRSGEFKYPHGSERLAGHKHRPQAAQSAENSRDMRVQVLDAIVSCLERKKPDWQKARILHLSSQLEESMFVSDGSPADYANPSTLPARINQHCLLLATRKTAIAAAAAAAATGDGDSSGSFQPCTSSLAASAVTTSQGQAGQQQYPPWVRGDGGGGADMRCPNGNPGVGVGDEGWPVEAGGGVSQLRVVGDMEASSGGNGNAISKSKQPHLLSGTNAAKSGHRHSHAADATSRRALKGKQDCFGLHHPAPAVDTSSSNSSTTNDGSGGVEAGGRAGSSGGRGRGCASAEPRDTDACREVKGGSVVVGTAFPAEEAVGRAGGGMDEACDGGGCAAQGSKETKGHALRLLQCRLLLLKHSAACTADGGACQLSPLCDSVRQLLLHMRVCRERETCVFPHCASSKAVLRHQHMCDDSGCGLCSNVRDLSQKCFWANARHAHKRRLQESHELRRKKRRGDGLSPPPPRKQQAEKAKTAREVCSGLDEAGNDLGDISLGFFLRQDKAVKARKISQENADSVAVPRTVPETVPGTVTVHPSADGDLIPPPKQEQQQQQQHQHQQRQEVDSGQELRDDATNAAKNAAAASAASAAMTVTIPSRSPAVINAFPSPTCNSFAPAGQPHGCGVRFSSSSSNSSNIGGYSGSSVGGFLGTGMKRQESKGRLEWTSVGARATKAAVAQAIHLLPLPREERASSGEISGGGAEAYAVEASPAERRGPAASGGGLTVAIPPAGLWAGHLRSPSEAMLNEIAESLADASRRPSFARMQSVQAFLDEHGELSQSASFGDVSALVEQWMSLEDGTGDDENLGMSSAFSF